MENIIFQLLIIKKLSEKDALTYIENCELPVVVKKDGLAAGKALLLQILLKQPEVLLRLCMVMKKKVLLYLKRF